MPALAGNRGILRWLDGILQGRADNQWVTVLRSLPGGRAEVKKPCHDEPFIVGVSPGISFAPGTQALAASNSGTHGDLIIGTAPGRSGGSAFAQAEARRSGVYNIKTPFSCPTVPLGKTYLGLYIDASATPDRLYAFRYNDGSYHSVAGFVDLTDISLFMTTGNPIQRIHPLGDVIIFRGQKDGDRCLVTWNIAAGTLKAAEPHLEDMGGPVWPGAGADMYFVHVPFTAGAQHIQLYRCPIGFEGDIDLETAKVGTEFIEGTGGLTCPTVLYASTVDFQIPSFHDDADEQAIPYFKAGSWGLGANRSYLTPGSNVNGYGYPGPGTGIVRANNYADFNETISILPAGPDTTERDLFPPEWNLSSVGHLAINPQRTEVVAYAIDGDGIPDAALLRVPIRTSTFNAECSVPYIAVDPATPTGEVPSVMLARD